MKRKPIKSTSTQDVKLSAKTTTAKMSVMKPEEKK